MTIAQAISRPSRWLSWQRVKRPLASMILTLGLLASGFPGFYLKHVDASALPSSTVEEPSSITESATALPENGVYLYGQSPEPNQIGHTYAVFEVTDNETVGAFYMPSSSFDCFYGEVESEELDLVVINSYDQASHPYSMPLDYENVASTSDSGESIPALVGYHRINDLSQQDHQILSTCRSNSDQRSFSGGDRSATTSQHFQSI
ncbi:MAG: hypothetical protein WBA10_08695 [Elainellaceae cyanobacterium]